MKARIQRSMLLIMMLMVILSYVLVTLITHDRTMRILENEMFEEAKYIVSITETLGNEYIEKMDAVDSNTRLTHIAADGTVLYDTGKDESKIENHGDRPEVISALQKGYGEDQRYSTITGVEMYYYARLLRDGSVIRVSKNVTSIMDTALDMLPIIAVIGAVMIVLAWLLMEWQTNRLIKPINELDVERPLDNPVYEELRPLLEAIDAHNKDKDAVANMRKEFSANVSHELKTPLTSISGYAEIMKSGFVRQEDMPVFSERIYKEARRLITLVEDIMKLSKLDEDAMERQRENVNLFALAKETCMRLTLQADEKHVKINLRGEKVEYHGIRHIIDEMLYNLCENAIKYNVDNGRVDIWVGNTPTGPVITVSDTGIGIPPEHHDRIFERFYRVDKSRSKETGGTGLGLSIVKHGAQLHGAKVSVTSEPGKGTTMKIEWGQA